MTNNYQVRIAYLLISAESKFLDIRPKNSGAVSGSECSCSIKILYYVKHYPYHVMPFISNGMLNTIKLLRSNTTLILRSSDIQTTLNVTEYAAAKEKLKINPPNLTDLRS